nr:cytochrome P450 6k1-like [Danaus plexippus plexippus]
MVYLDMAIKEAMRLHPSIATLSRRCVQNTVLPNGNIVVEKDTKIFIPVYELHHDEKYFPDPEAYKPERFSRENKHEIIEFTYLPFGKGNRTCIGMQYAHMQIKTGLVHMLRHFTVHTDIHQGKQKYLKHLIQLRLDHNDINFLTR